MKTIRRIAEATDCAGEAVLGEGNAPDPALIARVLGRLQNGWTPLEFQVVANWGVGPFLAQQLSGELADDRALNAMLSPLKTLGMSPADLLNVNPNQVIDELTIATLLRRIYSKNQFFERMVEFWTDHFNIDIGKSDCRFFKTVDDREVIRKYALGKFPEMLKASARSPAMLTYLDNRWSQKSGPNQNYARELLELQTLTKGFSQKDLEEVARCFTGWTVQTTPGPQKGAFQFVDSWHDKGSKKVLGHVIPAGGGISDGETVLQILANHPNTAKNIASKLCRFFLGESTTKTVESQVVGIYNSTGGDIPSMLAAILVPSLLLGAAPKLKRPTHLLVGMLRAMGPAIAHTNGLQQLLAGAGHLPFRWGPPNGYPDTFEFWSGALLPRWNFGFALCANQVWGVTLDGDPLTLGAISAGGLIERINERVFGGAMSASLRSSLNAYSAQFPFSPDMARDLWGLALSSPEYQFC